MVNVVINGKEHRNIEKLPVSKLEHLRQLAQIAVDNYIKAQKYSEPYFRILENRVQQIDSLIKEKQNA